MMLQKWDAQMSICIWFMHTMHKKSVSVQPPVIQAFCNYIVCGHHNEKTARCPFLCLSNWWARSVKGDAYVCKYWSASSLKTCMAKLMARTLCMLLNLLPFLLHLPHASQISSRQMCVCIGLLLFISATELFKTSIFNLSRSLAS